MMREHLRGRGHFVVILSILLISAAATAGGVATTSDNAEAEMLIDGVPESIEPGEEFTVNVTLDGTIGNEDTELTATELIVTYDDDLLSVTRFSNGTFIDGNVITDEQDGAFDYAVATEDEAGVTGAGTVVAVTFEVAEGEHAAINDETPIVFDDDGTGALDGDNNDVAVDAVGADLFIEDTVPPEADLVIEPDAVNVSVEPTTLDASNSDDNDAIDRYEWDITGDGSVDLETEHPNATIDHTFDVDELGPVDVTVTVVDEAGNTDEASATVNVIDEIDPDATIQASDVEDVEVGVNTVQFDAGGSEDNHAIDRYEWDLTGDGAIDENTTEPAVDHVFKHIGEQAVSVTVVDVAGNTDTASTAVSVVDTTSPDAALDVPDAVAEGATATFDASNSTDNHEIAEYQWSFGDGTETTTTDPVVDHVYDQTGNFTVAVTVVDESGNAETIERDVSVSESPAVTVLEPSDGDALSVTDPEITYELANTHLSDVEGGEVEYSVDGGDWQVVENGFVETDETADFTFQTSALDDGTHTVEIRIVDANGEPVDDTFPPTVNEVTFTVDTSSPTLALVSPVDGEQISYDNTLEFETGDDVTDVVTVEYAANTTEDGFVTLTDDPGETVELDVADEALPEGWTELTLRATDEAGNIEELTVEFRLVAEPTLEIVEPAPDKLVNVTEPTVIVTYDDGAPVDTGINTDAVELLVDGEPANLTDTEVEADGFTAVLDEERIDIADPDDSAHELAVTVADNAGHETSETRDFTIDAVAPRVDLTVAAEAADDDPAFPDVSPSNPAEITLSANDTRHAETMIEVRNGTAVVFSEDVTSFTGSGESLTEVWPAIDNDGNIVSSGTYEIAVVSRDRAGNVNDSHVETVDVDTDDPEITTIDVNVDNGSTIDDTIYANETTDLTISVDANDGQPGANDVQEVRVTISAEFTSFAIVVGADRVSSNSYEADIPVHILPEDGAYSVSVTAIDAAGSGTNEAPDDADQLRYDTTAPELGAVVTLDEEGEEGTVTVRSSELLANGFPTVTLERPDGTESDVDITPVAEDATRWNGTFEFDSDDESAFGTYQINATGADPAGNVETDTARSTVDSVTSEDLSAVVLNEDTEMFIQFNTTDEVTQSFVAISENDLPPEDLSDERVGAGFLTSELGAELDANLETATIHLPVEEFGDDFPDAVDPEDVNITYYNESANEGTGAWEEVDTDLVDVDEEFDDGETSVSGEYWVATVDDFSTYGTTAIDDQPPNLRTVEDHAFEFLVDGEPRIDDGSNEFVWDVEETVVRFEYEDEISGVDSSSVEINIVDRDDPDELVSRSTTASATNVTLAPEPGTTYTVQVIVQDEAGNFNLFERTFTVDDAPIASFTDITPVDGAEIDDASEPVDVRFDYDMQDVKLNRSATALRLDGGAFDDTVVELADENVEDLTVSSEYTEASIIIEANETYTAELTLVDEFARETTEQVTFAVEVPEPDPPTITDFSPVDSPELPADTETQSVTFEYDVPGSIDETGSTVTVNGESVDADFGENTVEIVVPVEPGESYDVVLELIDENGNTATESTTFSIEAVDDGAGGGGGGGGGGGDEPALGVDIFHLDDQVTIRLTDVPGGTSATFDLEDSVTAEGVSVHEIVLNTRISGPDFRIEIDQPTLQPTSAPPVDAADPIAYFEVRTFSLDDSTIDNVDFRFSMAPGSLPSDANEEDVTLYRYSDGEWTALETVHQGSGEYIATTPGFSTFAIAIEEPAADEPAEDQPDEESAEEQTEDEATDEPTEESTEDDDTIAEIPGFGPVVTLMALILTMLGFQFRRQIK